MLSRRPDKRPRSKEAATVTKAAMRAMRQLGITSRTFAKIVGLPEASVSRMHAGDHELRPDEKTFQLALLVVQLYRSLDAIVGGEDEVARSWLRTPNTTLGAEPLTLIQTVSGLTDVIQYLEARRRLAA